MAAELVPQVVYQHHHMQSYIIPDETISSIRPYRVFVSPGDGQIVETASPYFAEQ